MSGYPYASVGGFVVPPVVSGLDDNYVPSRDGFRGYDDTMCFEARSDWYNDGGMWMGRIGHGPPAGARGWVYKGHFPGFGDGPPFDLYWAPEGDKGLGEAWEDDEWEKYEREEERRRRGGVHGGSRSHGSSRGHGSGHTHASMNHSSHSSIHRSGAPSTRHGSSHRSGLSGSHHSSGNAFQSSFESHRGSVHGSRYGLGSSHHGSRHDSNFGGHSSHHGHHSSHGRSHLSSHHGGGGSREGTRYGLASSHHGAHSSHHGGAASRHGTSRPSALRTELSW